MGRIILALAIALIAFAGGLFGMYQAMPRLDPERVERTQDYLDSLALADTLAEMDSLRLSLLEPPPMLIPDSLRQQMLVRDAQLLAMQDSLGLLRSEIQTSNEQIRELRGELEGLLQQWQEMEARREEASKMSGTLTRLEDNELEQVLARLDLPVLEQLYIESTNRSRTRLLQALDPNRAALVVRSLMDALQMDSPAADSAQSAAPGLPPAGPNPTAPAAG